MVSPNLEHSGGLFTKVVYLYFPNVCDCFVLAFIRLSHDLSEFEPSLERFLPQLNRIVAVRQCFIQCQQFERLHRILIPPFDSDLHLELTTLLKDRSEGFQIPVAVRVKPTIGKELIQ